VPTAEYFIKQAEIAGRMALAEPDPEKARAMHILALEYYDRAYRAQIQAGLLPEPRTIQHLRIVQHLRTQ
jgi:hypothetical protein